MCDETQQFTLCNAVINTLLSASGLGIRFGLDGQLARLCHDHLLVGTVLSTARHGLELTHHIHALDHLAEHLRCVCSSA